MSTPIIKVPNLKLKIMPRMKPTVTNPVTTVTETTTVTEKKKESPSEIYAKAFLEYGKNIYNITFSTLATKYGKEYFPTNWTFLVNSHPDGEFRLTKCDDDDDKVPTLDDFIKANNMGNPGFDASALWMLTENWYYEISQGVINALKSITQMRQRLREDDLIDTLVTDEELGLLIEFIKCDSDPYWAKDNSATATTATTVMPVTIEKAVEPDEPVKVDEPAKVKEVKDQLETLTLVDKKVSEKTLTVYTVMKYDVEFPDNSNFFQALSLEEVVDMAVKSYNEKKDGEKDILRKNLLEGNHCSELDGISDYSFFSAKKTFNV